MAFVLTGDARLGGASSLHNIDLRKTFLRTSSDPQALNANALSLAALSLTSGDLVMIDAFTSSGIVHPNFTAMFSSSSSLGPSNTQNRVTGALSTTNAWTGTVFGQVATPATQVGSLVTNVTRDFLLENESNPANPDAMPAFAIVPVNATHLFVSAIDRFFGDNSGTFRLDIDRPLVIGISGAGTGVLQNVSHVAETMAVIGMGPGSDGTLTLTGASSLQVGGVTGAGGQVSGGGLVVGMRGTGVVNVEAGNSITVGSESGVPPDFDGDGSMMIGFADQGNGTLNVTGDGARVVVKGVDGVVFMGGTGGAAALNLTGGGTLTAQSIVTGFGTGGEGSAGGTASITVTGTGSKITLSADDIPSGYDQSQSTVMALLANSAGSAATLNVTRGADVDIRSSTNENSNGMMLGNEFGSQASAVFDGGGTSLNIKLNAPAQGGDGAVLMVGNRGEGSFVASRSAVVNIKGHDAGLFISHGDEVDFPDTNPPVNALALSTMRIESGADVFVTASGKQWLW